MKSRIALVAVSLLALTPGSDAYHFIQHITPDRDIVNLFWSDEAMPVPYFVNNKQPLDFSLQTAVDAIDQSFQTWEMQVFPDGQHMNVAVSTTIEVP